MQQTNSARCAKQALFNPFLATLLIYDWARLICRFCVGKSKMVRFFKDAILEGPMISYYAW